MILTYAIRSDLPVLCARTFRKRWGRLWGTRANLWWRKRDSGRFSTSCRTFTPCTAESSPSWRIESDTGETSHVHTAAATGTHPCSHMPQVKGTPPPSFFHGSTGSTHKYNCYILLWLLWLFLRSGRRARGSLTSSCPEKQSSWFLPRTSDTTTGAWTCWRTAAGLHLALLRLFTSLRSDRWQLSNTKH